MTPKRREIARDFGISLILVLAVVLVFGQTVGHKFVNYDDDKYVYANPYVTGPFAARALWCLTHSQQGHWHPLTALSHIVDYQLFGMVPAGHHFTNLLLHTATSILLFLWLRGAILPAWPSALAAALFALHPLRAESVGWISDRKDLLSGLFFMLTLHAYTRYVAKPQSIARYVTAILLYALGLLAKSSLIAMPLLLLALDYWPYGRSRSASYSNADATCTNGNQLRIAFRLAMEKVPFLVLGIGIAYADYLGQSAGTMTTIGRLAPHQRLGHAAVSYCSYAAKFFWPTQLAAFYPQRDISIPFGQLAGSLAIGCGLLTAGICLRRKYPYLLIGWLWYLIMFLPVMGVLPHAMADRYTYLPQIGLAIIVAWSAATLARTRYYWMSLLSTLILVAAMTAAWHQTATWRDSRSLWTHALSCGPETSVAHCGMATVLAELGRDEEAAHHYCEALRINPQSIVANINLGCHLVRLGQRSAANKYFLAALEIDPDFDVARENLAKNYYLQNQNREALTQCRELLKRRPADIAALNMAAWIEATSADETLRNGADATNWARKAAQFVGHDAITLDTLAAALAESGQFNEAVATLEKALVGAPSDDPLAKAMRGRLGGYRAGKPYREIAPALER